MISEAEYLRSLGALDRDAYAELDEYARDRCRNTGKRPAVELRDQLRVRVRLQNTLAADAAALLGRR